jgi:hypothetical protein
VWIDIRDHHGTLDAHNHLRMMMQEMVCKLDLKCMTFRVTSVMFGLKCNEQDHQRF